MDIEEAIKVAKEWPYVEHDESMHPDVAQALLTEVERLRANEAKLTAKLEAFEDNEDW